MLPISRWSAYEARKSLLEQFDTECLDLVYMLRSREPAVGGANMTLRGGAVPTSAESSARTVGLLGASGSKQIDTSLCHATPRCV